MQHLAVEVALLHVVVVHNAYPSDAGRGEVQANRGPETPGPDHENGGLLELPLVGDPEGRENELPRVPLDLFLVQPPASPLALHRCASSPRELLF